MSAFITNIQRYAIHDGGGIRTTVFFKGCPLACSWCHNPENMSFDDSGESLPHKSGRNTGFQMPPRDLARRLLREMIFFGDSGGVTLSGGEPLAQDMAYITELLGILKQKGVNVACDTCGDVPWENISAVLPFIDTFLYDIKIASRDLHIRHTGKSNERIIANLERLCLNEDSLAKIWLRVPVVGGVNDGAEMANIIALAKQKAPNRKVSLLPYHHLGEDKWAKLGKPPPSSEFYIPPLERMVEIAADWGRAGFEVTI